MISLIVAFDEDRGIGKGNTIPWFIPGELKWVGETTRATRNPDNANALIMGRNTWDSLPEDRRPLPGRITVVITSQAKTVSKRELLGTDSPMVVMVSSLKEAIQATQASSKIETAYIFGGERVYREAMASPYLDELLLTQVPGTHNCDTFFPEVPDAFVCLERDDAMYGEIIVQRERYRRQK